MQTALVQMDLLLTPLENCLAFSPGAVDQTQLERMQASGFDDAPVLCADKVLGVVSLSTLEELALRNHPLTIDAVRVTDRRMWLVCSANARISVTHLLDALIQERCTFICDAPRSVLDPAGPVRGFLTISDLNRHAFRTAMYNILAELEARLAFVIESRYGDPWDWIRRLSEEHQVRILGYWDLSKRTGLDVGPVSAATLTNLLKVAGQNADLLSILGFVSRSAYDKAIGGLPGIRNCVMHPARPLITRHSDIERILKAVRLATTLHQALVGVNSRGDH
jgi:hypothetical protein